MQLCSRTLCWIVCLAAAAVVWRHTVHFGNGVRGSGVSASQTRDVQPFTGIRLEGLADIDASISDHTEVTVTTDDNILPLVETTNSGDELVIRETQNINPKHGVHIVIKTPNLDDISVSGAGDANIHDLKGSTFSVNISGAGNIAATGQTDNLKVTVSGAGDANLADLVAHDATISLSGAGDAKINSTATLDIKLSGVGNVSYKGNPQLTKHVSGVGSVTKM